MFGVFRTYPIRVANRGEEYSGPCWFDSVETTFEDLGQPQEMTTVTGLPRRIFTFSQLQAQAAITQNRMTRVFLNFCNYVPTFEGLFSLWETLDRACAVTHLGFGPKASDIYHVGAPVIERAHVRKIWEQYRGLTASNS